MCWIMEKKKGSSDKTNEQQKGEGTLQMQIFAGRCAARCSFSDYQPILINLSNLTNAIWLVQLIVVFQLHLKHFRHRYCPRSHT